MIKIVQIIKIVQKVKTLKCPKDYNRQKGQNNQNCLKGQYDIAWAENENSFFGPFGPLLLLKFHLTDAKQFGFKCFGMDVDGMSCISLLFASEDIKSLPSHNLIPPYTWWRRNILWQNCCFHILLRAFSWKNRYKSRRRQGEQRSSKEVTTYLCTG